MNSLIKELFKWPIVIRLRTPDNDDEHVDRLNHRVTVGLILCGAFITSTTSFVMNRISCWLPTELKHSSYIKYIEHYCLISNTYYIHSNVTPPHSDDDRRQAQIGIEIVDFIFEMYNERFLKFVRKIRLEIL
jgi:hypothetical protein